MNKTVDISTFLNKILEDRIMNIVNELSKNKRYLQLEEIIDNLFITIEEKTNIDLSDVFEEIEENQFNLSIMELVHVYKRGLFEGAKVLETLGYLDFNVVNENGKK